MGLLSASAHPCYDSDTGDTLDETKIFSMIRRQWAENAPFSAKLCGMATCVIVDDSHQFRSAASHILQRGGITVVGTAANTAEALAAIDESRPDVALIDVRLGHESGFALAERISQTSGSPMVILVSANPAEDLEQNITCPFLMKTELSGVAIDEIVSDHTIMNDNEAVTAYA